MPDEPTPPNGDQPGTSKPLKTIAAWIGGGTAVVAALIAFGGQLAPARKLLCGWGVFSLCDQPPMPPVVTIIQCAGTLDDIEPLKSTFNSLGIITKNVIQTSYGPATFDPGKKESLVASSIDNSSRKEAGEWLARRLSHSGHLWSYRIGGSLYLTDAEAASGFIAVSIGSGCQRSPTLDARWKEHFFPDPALGTLSVSMAGEHQSYASQSEADQDAGKMGAYFPSIHFEVAQLSAASASGKPRWTIIVGKGLSPSLATRARLLLRDTYIKTNSKIPASQLDGSLVEIK